MFEQTKKKKHKTSLKNNTQINFIPRTLEWLPFRKSQNHNKILSQHHQNDYY